jgi:hypothetical protein
VLVEKHKNRAHGLNEDSVVLSDPSFSTKLKSLHLQLSVRGLLSPKLTTRMKKKPESAVPMPGTS